ncbi:hypothetical protein LLH06_08690 [Mucilaginibacter daejeonensis]|uniref:hypothetical protein n=1 Tax=Mucilaginibacter daejeonensis TaxID=398049 RepID=UPI001D176900|nr:hypothetical protein [Mucilaginibacter daejeonensis]UEG55039.1 hypothetical protein LLH06_08690 [Mucilaginibacter daejeonensis]
METYFEPYFELQRAALDIMQHKAPRHKFLEDYLTIVPDISFFERQQVLEQIQPLTTIAKNNGFDVLPIIRMIE